MQVVVLGASGFVGTAVCTDMARQGWDVRRLVAPRVRADASDWTELAAVASQQSPVRADLVRAIDRADAVVNAAGLATPTGVDGATLTGANALLPLLLAEACAMADVSRLVHISSAVVQGARTPLDETASVEAGSTYALTKALGEQAIAAASSTRPAGSAVILRPTSVHAAQRSLTRGLARLARSPLASVMGPGDGPTPQVLVENVASAVAYLCRPSVQPPAVVLQPWEGWTTRGFLRLMGGREPRRVPGPVANAVLCSARRCARSGRPYAYRRRLELLWCGQAQVPGWLAEQGFVPPAGIGTWERLAAELAGGVRA
jgi:nucleoside-diphosphate-sugar epimerase